MKEERMMILNMLQEGRITVDEATKLLDSLYESPHKEFFKQWKHKEKSFDENVNKFSNSVENLAKDFSVKVESTYKELEPMLKKASQTVVEKTAKVVDYVSCSLNETLENLKKAEEECCNEEEGPVDNDGNPINEEKEENQE